MAICAFTFVDLFSTHTSTWWPILYMRSIVTVWRFFCFFFGELFFHHIFMAYKVLVPLFTYSVLLPPIYTYTYHFLGISISTTSSWLSLYPPFFCITWRLSLYTRDFYGLFCSFVSPSWPYLYIFYAYLWIPSCTLTYSLWPILCVWKIFDSLLIYPNFDLNLWLSSYSREFFGLFW